MFELGSCRRVSGNHSFSTTIARSPWIIAHPTDTTDEVSVSLFHSIICHKRLTGELGFNMNRWLFSRATLTRSYVQDSLADISGVIGYPLQVSQNESPGHCALHIYPRSMSRSLYEVEVYVVNQVIHFPDSTCKFHILFVERFDTQTYHVLCVISGLLYGGLVATRQVSEDTENV